jgi:hypothetical protein
VRVKWAAPFEDHGSAVLSYLLEVASDGAGFSTAYRGPDTSCKVQNLAPAQRYEFRVSAISAVGVGPASEAAAVTTTLAAPPPPAGLRAEPAEQPPGSAAGEALVAWEPATPAAGSCQAAAVGYEVDASLIPGKASGHARPGSTRQECGAGSTQLILTGLQPGGKYTVRIRSIGGDGAGHSEWSEARALALPGAPPVAVSPAPPSVDGSEHSARSQDDAKTVVVAGGSCVSRDVKCSASLAARARLLLSHRLLCLQGRSTPQPRGRRA